MSMEKRSRYIFPAAFSRRLAPATSAHRNDDMKRLDVPASLTGP
jgi:hypothetical protein